MVLRSRESRPLGNKHVARFRLDFEGFGPQGKGLNRMKALRSRPDPAVSSLGREAQGNVLKMPLDSFRKRTLSSLRFIAISFHCDSLHVISCSQAKRRKALRDPPVEEEAL